MLAVAAVILRLTICASFVDRQIWNEESDIGSASARLQSTWIEKWMAAVPEMMAMKPQDANAVTCPLADASNAVKSPAAEVAEKGTSFQEQRGMPDEEDMRNWSHHFNVNTCDDPVFREAMQGYDTVSFVFGLRVTWDLLEARRKEEEEAMVLQELNMMDELSDDDNDNDDDDDDDVDGGPKMEKKAKEPTADGGDKKGKISAAKAKPSPTKAKSKGRSEKKSSRTIDHSDDDEGDDGSDDMGDFIVGDDGDAEGEGEFDGSERAAEEEEDVVFSSEEEDVASLSDEEDADEEQQQVQEVECYTEEKKEDRIAGKKKRKKGKKENKEKLCKKEAARGDSRHDEDEEDDDLFETQHPPRRKKKLSVFEEDSDENEGEEDQNDENEGDVNALLEYANSNASPPMKKIKRDMLHSFDEEEKKEQERKCQARTSEAADMETDQVSKPPSTPRQKHKRNESLGASSAGSSACMPDIVPGETKIIKFFAGFGDYTGTVISHNPDSDKYLIEYTDGDNDSMTPKQVAKGMKKYKKEEEKKEKENPPPQDRDKLSDDPPNPPKIKRSESVGGVSSAASFATSSTLSGSMLDDIVYGETKIMKRFRNRGDFVGTVMSHDPDSDEYFIGYENGNSDYMTPKQVASGIKKYMKENPPPSDDPNVPAGYWACRGCTLHNSVSRKTCSACKAKRAVADEGVTKRGRGRPVKKKAVRTP